MVEHTLRTVHESLVQGYCATADCATVDCARLRDKRYYCTTGKEKNTTSYARNTSWPLCSETGARLDRQGWRQECIKRSIY